MLWVRVPAKVNLFLEVRANRADGYHDLRMLLQTISLSDRVGLELLPTGVEVVCSHPQVPQDETNLAVRAARLLQQLYPDRGGVRITIEKHIPVGGGLAGGSSNGAGVLWGLNRLWQLGLSVADLQSLALRLGSDVPFCVGGGTAIAEGRGELLTPVPYFPALHLVIAKPVGVAVSTAWAYQTFRAQQLLRQKTRDTDSLWHQLLIASDPEGISQCLYNDLERVVLPAVGTIAGVRQQLMELGCLGSLMSGSGACVLGICRDETHAQRIREQLQVHQLEAWAVVSGNFQPSQEP